MSEKTQEFVGLCIMLVLLLVITVYTYTIGAFEVLPVAIRVSVIIADGIAIAWAGISLLLSA